MYSIVLMAAMTATPETPGFGDIWAKHCFWECCLPARYGWVPCGPGYSAVYPASYTSCYGYGLGGGYVGYGSYYAGWGSYYGGHGGYSGWGSKYTTSNYGYRDVCFGSGALGSNYGYAGWGSNYGYGFGYGIGAGSFYHACGGGYYNCFGGGAWTGPLAGSGYSGFGGYGNFGYYNTVPFYSAPVYAAPGFDRPLNAPIRTAPTESRPILDIKPIPVQPTPVQPQKTMAVPAKASVVVRVPENAKVFIDGNLMHSTSTERKFTSPAIAAGESFFYTIRVVIQKEGKEVEEVRQVTVKAGEVSRLAFDNLFDRVRPEERTIVDANKNPVK